MISDHYTCTTGGHHKYWRIEYDPTLPEWTTYWGRIGTSGMQRTKTFHSVRAAHVARLKLVSEKLAKGYTLAYTKVGGVPVKTKYGYQAPKKYPAPPAGHPKPASRPSADVSATQATGNCGSSPQGRPRRRVRLTDD